MAEAVIKPATDLPPWPLPEDYYTLTTTGRQECRRSIIAARTTPDQLFAAWWLWRNYYLNWEGANFYKEFKESPSFHRELVEFWAQYRLNAIGAPRNSAKSTVIGLELPLLETVSPGIKNQEILFVLATRDFCLERIEKMMFQVDHNARIRDDFGQLRPKKSETGSWNKTRLRLRNGVTVRALSVDGRKRGVRADLVVIDDPEYDPEGGSNIMNMNLNLNQMLLRQIVGMLGPTSRLFWIGTLLHAKSYLFHILHTEETRFRSWNRRIYKAVQADTSGKETYLWENRLTPEFLEAQKEIMGLGAWRAEYCNDPRSDEETVLSIDSVLNEYHLDRPEHDPTKIADPFSSDTKVRFNEVSRTPEGTVLTTPTELSYSDLLNSMQRFMTVDYAFTQHAMSDFSAAVVWGIDPRNTLWVLSAWRGKVRSEELVRIIWYMGKKWRVKSVGIEAISVQDEVRQRVQDFMNLMSSTGEWTPRVRAIRYPPGVTKESRIGNLEWRFTGGRIKFPSWLKYESNREEAMKDLYQETEDFTPDLSRLPNDDLIDALSMMNYMVSGAGTPTDVKKSPGTIAERIIAGELYLEGHPGISLLNSIPIEQITPEMERAIAEASVPRGNPRLAEANFEAPYTDEDFDPREIVCLM